MQLAVEIPLWLIDKFTPVRYREALLGDLREELAAGRSCAWLWREALAAALAIRWGLKRRAIAILKAAVLALGLSVVAAGTLSWAQTLQKTCDAVERCPR